MNKTSVNEALFEFVKTIYEFQQKEFKKFSLTWQEILLLKNLMLSKDWNMGDVTTMLKIQSFQTTRLVDGLIKKGLVVRSINEEDKRVKSITITTKGKESIKEIDDFHYFVIENAAKDLGIERTKEIIETIFHLEQLLGLTETNKLKENPWTEKEKKLF